MILTLNQKKLLVLIRKRVVTDTFAWFILLLLIIGYIPIHLYSLYLRPSSEGYDNFISFVTLHKTTDDIEAGFNALHIVIREAILYLIAIMIMVYFNLEVIKKQTLDKLPPYKFRYIIYLVTVLIVAAILAGIWTLVDIKFPSLLRMNIRFARAGMINFTFALISTGLIYLKTLKDVQMKNEGLKAEIKNMRKELINGEITPHKDHLVVGSKTNWDKVFFDEILFLKGSGNEPKVQLENDWVYGHHPLKEFEEKLPSSLFIRTHRSFIIAKNKVVGRRGKELKIRDKKGAIHLVPISDSYLDAVDRLPNWS